MEEYLKIEIEKDPTSNDIQPRGISVSRPRSGDYFDATEDQNKDKNHHIPSVNDFHIIGRYAPHMIPLNLHLFSKDEIDGGSVKGLYFTRTPEQNYESIEIIIDKYKKSYYILVRIDY
jgi:hypothetical protein